MNELYWEVIAYDYLEVGQYKNAVACKVFAATEDGAVRKAHEIVDRPNYKAHTVSEIMGNQSAIQERILQAAEKLIKGAGEAK